MKVDEFFALDLPQDKRVSRVKAASFHPLQNKIAIGFRRDIYEYDLISGSRVAQYTTESEITHLAHAHTHNVLIAALKNGCFSALDLTSHTLTAFHIPIRSTEKRPVSYFAVSRTRPFIFYVRDRALSVSGIEMFADSKNRVEYTHKKQISCITTHPKKNIMVSASIDGNVRIWDTASHQLLASFDEFGTDKSLRSPVTYLCYFSSKDPSKNSPIPHSTSNGNLTSRSHYNSAHAASTDLLVTGTKGGRVQVWYIAPTEQRVVATMNLNEWIVSIFFHATLPCLMVLNHKGCLKAINIGHLITNFNNGSVPSMKGILTKFEMVDTFYAPLHDTSFHNSQKNLKSLIPAISAQMNENSGLLVLFGKNYQISNLNTPNVRGVIVSEYYPIFNIVDDSDFPASTLPQSTLFPFTLDMVLPSKSAGQEATNGFFADEPEFEVPISDFIYMDTFTATPHDILMKYTIATDSSKRLQLLKTSPSLAEYHRCIQMKANRAKTHLLVFYEKQRQQSSYISDNRTRFFLALDLSKKTEIPPLEAGKDGDFLESDNPNSQEYFILDEDGMSIRVYELGASAPSKTAKLAVKISRIFSCPFKRNINLYYNRANSVIGFANDDLTFGMNKKPTFDLRQNEIPISVQWQKTFSLPSSPESFMIGLLTTHRVLILDETLRIRATVESPLQTRKSLYFQSCLWLGNVLLYNTCSAVYCLCPNMLEQTSGAHSNFALCTLEHANSVLSGILYDRIFFTCYRNNCPQMSVRYVNIIEPLILSIISLNQTQETKLKMMQSIVSKFDCRSVSERTLLSLERSGFADLASELITHSVYDFSWELRFRLALNSLQFAYAFEILRTQYQRNVVQEQVDVTPTSPLMDHRRGSFSEKSLLLDEEYCTDNSPFYAYFVELAEMSIEHAHFVIAAKCYDIINDSWSLFRLFSMYSKEVAILPLSRLAMRCKNSPDLYTIYMACRVVLADSYDEHEEAELFKLYRGNFGKKRLNLELGTLETVQWRTAQRPVSIEKRSFDLGTSFKGTMKIKQDKSKQNVQNDSPMPLPSLSTGDEYIEPLSLSNFSQWMGYNIAETKKSDNDWDRVDFASDFGAGMSTKRSRSDSVSSSSEDSVAPRRKASAHKGPSLPSLDLPNISGVKIPPLQLGVSTDEGLETERDADGEDTMSEATANTATNVDKENGEDDEGFSERPDLDKIRKQYMGGSSSDENSSSDDGDGDSYRKKRKLFRKLKIKDKSEVNSAPAKVDFSAFKLSGPGSIGGPASVSAPSNPRASRRLRGRTTTVVADVSPVLGNNTDTNDEGTSSSQEGTSSPNSVSSPPVAIPKPVANLPVAPVVSNVNPADALKKGMALMESGNYRDARASVNEAISALANDNSEILKKTNLLLCVRYKLLIMMLTHNQRLEARSSPTQGQDIARNSFLLAQIKVTNKHQVICRNLASRKNMQAGNYGLAARLIRLLLPVTPPQHRPEVQQRMNQCEAEGFRNVDKELDNAAQRAEQEGVGEDATEFLQIKFCWRTFELFKSDQREFLACPYCDALYLPGEAVEQDQRCFYCSYGSLEARHAQYH